MAIVHTGTAIREGWPAYERLEIGNWLKSKEGEEETGRSAGGDPPTGDEPELTEDETE